MRVRLVLLVVATSSLVLVAFFMPLALLLRTVAADRAVSKATVEAQSLAPLVAPLASTSLRLAVEGVNAQSGALPVTVFLPGGATLGVATPRSPAVELAVQGRSLTAETPGGREVLVAVQGLPGGTAVIRTFVSDAELRRGVTRSWLVLGAVAVGLLALSAVVADQLARYLVRPLAAVARASHQLASGDLAVRAAVGGPPEVVQVSTGLNLLGTRIGELLARERETVADMSHRLRTPLTVLRVDTESLSNRQEMALISGDVDALERTVNEIIHEARRPVREGVHAACEAACVVRERAAFWSPLAADQDRWMRVEVAPGPIQVRVAREDLAACVDTLLENVFAHTPAGAGFIVRLTGQTGGGAHLLIADDGPGFADASIAQRGISNGGSTGLGLDIVRRTAEASGGTLSLARSPAGGAAVIVELGPPLDLPQRGRRSVVPAATWFPRAGCDHCSAISRPSVRERARRPWARAAAARRFGTGTQRRCRADCLDAADASRQQLAARRPGAGRRGKRPREGRLGSSAAGTCASRPPRSGPSHQAHITQARRKAPRYASGKRLICQPELT